MIAKDGTVGPTGRQTLLTGLGQVLSADLACSRWQCATAAEESDEEEEAKRASHGCCWVDRAAGGRFGAGCTQIGSGQGV